MSLNCLTANAAHMSTVVHLLADIAAWYFTGGYDYPFPPARRAVLLTLMLSFMMPFCFVKEQHSLRHIPTASVSTCIILCFSMVVIATERLLHHGPASGDEKVPAAIWDADALLSGGAAICFIYSSVAACMLGEGNVLFMVPASNGWVTFWSFMLVVVITLLYPVINLLVVKEFETVIALLVTSEIITIVAAAVVILLDTLVNDLASLFGLCGSLGMSTVSMILPPLMFLYSP
eukprot:gene22134-26676_t